MNWMPRSRSRTPCCRCRSWRGRCADAGSAVVLEVLVDLGLPLPGRGLVDRELHLPAPVRHHLGHERGILRGDILVVEVLELREAHHVAVVRDELVHVPQRHVPHDVIHVEERAVRGLPAGRLVPRQERAPVLRTVDEGMHGIAVRSHRRAPDLAPLILHRGRLLDALRAPLRRLAVGAVHVLHLECYVVDAVPVEADLLGHEPFRPQRRREHEAHPALLQHVGSAVAHAGLEARVAVAVSPNACW